MKFEINKRFLYYRMTNFLWLHTFIYEIVDPISNMNRNHHFYVMCLSTWFPSEAIIYCPSICHHHLREVWRVWIIYILVSDKWYLRSWLREVWMRKGHFQGFPELSIYKRIRFMRVFFRDKIMASIMASCALRQFAQTLRDSLVISISWRWNSFICPQISCLCDLQIMKVGTVSQSDAEMTSWDSIASTDNRWKNWSFLNQNCIVVHI